MLYRHASSVKVEINKSWQELSFSHRDFAASCLRVNRYLGPTGPLHPGGRPTQARAPMRASYCRELLFKSLCVSASLWFGS